MNRWSQLTLTRRGARKLLIRGLAEQVRPTVILDVLAG
jgi:hypothetical protein